MGEETDFAYLKLDGPRFQGRGMPVNSVAEVAQFRNAVFTVARRLYLNANPERSNLPAHFEEAFDLRLIDVEAGSAIPKLVLDRTKLLDLPDGASWEDALHRAVPALAAVVLTLTGTVGDAGLGTIELTPRELGAVVKLGHTLGEAESMVFADSSQSESIAVLDEPARTTMREAVRTVVAPPAERVVTITGVIEELDGAGGHCRLRAEDGSLVQVGLSSDRPRLAETAKRYLAPDGVTAPDVDITGIVDVPDGERVRVLRDATHIELVRTIWEKVLVDKITMLSELEPGWWGPGSVAPDAQALRHVEELIPILGRMDVAFAIASTPEGSIVMEWTREGTTYVAEIEPGDLMYLYRGGEQYEDREAPYDAATLTAFAESGTLT